MRQPAFVTTLFLYLATFYWPTVTLDRLSNLSCYRLDYHVVTHLKCRLWHLPSFRHHAALRFVPC